MLETTEEVTQRATEFVVDRLLELANAVGGAGTNAASLRLAAHLAPNPASELQELAARMLYGLALSLDAGSLTCNPVQPTPAERRVPFTPPPPADLAAEGQSIVTKPTDLPSAQPPTE